MGYEFVENFEAFIHQAFSPNSTNSYHLIDKAKKLSPEEMYELFSKEDSRWLTKELSRMKIKATGENSSVQGTLLNLQIICKLTGLSPNQILMSKMTSDDTANSPLLTLEALQELCMMIDEHKDLMWNFFIPIFHNLQAMYLGFLQIYEEKKEAKKNVYFRFWHFQIKNPVVSSYNEINFNDIIDITCSNSFNIDNVVKEKEGLIYHNKRKIPTLSEFYKQNSEKIKTPYEVVNEMIQEFYASTSEWAMERQDEAQLLLRWYPPNDEIERPVKTKKKSLENKIKNAYMLDDSDC